MFVIETLSYNMTLTNFNLSRIFKSIFSKPILEKHMQHFSEEYLNKLVAEHKMVSASLARLKGPEFNAYARSHTADQVNSAIYNFSVQRVELEAKIDVLRDYLQG